MPGNRRAMLDAFEQELQLCFGGSPRLPLMQKLQHTIEHHNLPPDPFFRLIEANRRDQYIQRYETFTDLLDYCTYSANPVGRLVLALFGITGESEKRLSDATCTALQLTNFWQDVAIDLDKDRLYIPMEDMRQAEYDVDMLANHTVNTEWRQLMRFQINRTRQFFAEGKKLLAHVTGRLRMEIGLFTLGGLTVLDKIEKNDYDVFTKRIIVSKRRKSLILWRALTTYAPWKRVR